MTDDKRSIEMEVEVAGDPEAVWDAIATGPGITSWYVPHVVEEHEGGKAIASFGLGPEMQVEGRVAAWEPPKRIVFDGGEGVEGLAFEWLVEARSGGTCVVRLVNTGFGSGEPWDDQYDMMKEGWKLFMLNLRLHLEHFAPQRATAMLPAGMWPGPQDRAWTALLDGLGLAADVSVGDHVTATAGTDGPRLTGTVVDVDSWRLALVVDEPAPGTALLAAEGTGDAIGMSVWSYLYGSEGESVIERDQPRWQAWLERQTAPAADG